MKTYIVLLRGINVGGQKKIKMADLRQSLEQRNFFNVQTYIQSGNIICQSAENDPGTVGVQIQETIKEDFGFDVPSLAFTEDMFKQILDANPFNSAEEKNLYFVLLRTVPEKELVEQCNLLQFENEEFEITDSCVYLNCYAGYGKAKLSNNLMERKLKVEATARNLRTMKKLLEMVKS
nr:DUF1697 domain-containing protein [Allomuricauda sp.]